MNSIDEDHLSEVFAALANSTRRAILSHLAAGAATVNEIAAPFDLTLPAISKHIKVLEGAGLVVRARHARFRPCALDAAPLQEVCSWAEQYHFPMAPHVKNLVPHHNIYNYARLQDVWLDK